MKAYAACYLALLLPLTLALAVPFFKRHPDSIAMNTNPPPTNALNSTFAKTHHLGHGPVVVSGTNSTSALPPAEGNSSAAVASCYSTHPKPTHPPEGANSNPAYLGTGEFAAPPNVHIPALPLPLPPKFNGPNAVKPGFTGP